MFLKIIICCCCFYSNSKPSIEAITLMLSQSGQKSKGMYRCMQWHCLLFISSNYAHDTSWLRRDWTQQALWPIWMEYIYNIKKYNSCHCCFLCWGGGWSCYVFCCCFCFCCPVKNYIFIFYIKLSKNHKNMATSQRHKSLSAAILCPAVWMSHVMKKASIYI